MLPYCVSYISHPTDKGFFLSIYIQFLKIKSVQITRLLHNITVHSFQLHKLACCI